MAKRTSQHDFLVNHLRGTGRELTSTVAAKQVWRIKSTRSYF